MNSAPSGWGIEPWGGSGGASSGGGLPPFVTNISPTPGTLLEPGDAIAFDILDTDSLMRRIIVLVRYPNIGTVEAAYEISGLTQQFSLNSTVTPILNGYHFRLIRAGGWPDNSVSLVIDAIDVNGNED